MRTNKYTQRRKGIVTPYGQWQYPGKVTTIPSNDITMKGVPYPVLGVSDADDVKMMMPGMDYMFRGNEVTEYPITEKYSTGRILHDPLKSMVIKSRFSNGYPRVFRDGSSRTSPHRGIDLDSGINNEVYSPGYGKVVQIKNLEEGDGGGRIITVQTEDGLLHTFMHLNKFGNYKVGDSVDPGDVVGYTGGSGLKENNHYGPHLHYQVAALPENVKFNGNYANYQKYTIDPSLYDWSSYDGRGLPEKHDVSFYPFNIKEIGPEYLPQVNPVDTTRYMSEYFNNKEEDDLKEQTGGIHINPKNKGKFTAAAKRAGKSVQAYAAQILANKENYSPTLVKRANFARNASKWKHQEGGIKPSFEEYYKSLPAYKNDTINYDLRTAYQFLPYEEMKQFATMPEKHLSSVVELPDGSYRFLKSKNHPSLQQELDWYNSDDAKEFRNNYILDTSEEYYRYVPKKHQIGKYLEGNYVQPQTVGNVMNSWNDMLAKGLSKGDNAANIAGTILGLASTIGGAAASQWGAENGKQDWMNGKKKGNDNVSFSLSSRPDIGSTLPATWGNEIARQGIAGMQAAKYAANNPLNPFNNPSLPGFKLATGGNTAQLAEIERGEIVSTPTGNSIANGRMNYHELYSNDNEQTGNVVNLTDNMQKDVARNPQLSPVSKRVNRYTSMRRNGNTFIFPSTVGLNGKILEPKNGINYPLAELINNR